MPDNNYEMKIVFAGDSMIKIISEVIEVTLDDKAKLGKRKISPNTRYNVKIFGLIEKSL